ncbi:unnamed protein product, partial [Owenia fusiformis]
MYDKYKKCFFVRYTEEGEDLWIHRKSNPWSPFAGYATEKGVTLSCTQLVHIKHYNMSENSAEIKAWIVLAACSVLVILRIQMELSFGVITVEIESEGRNQTTLAKQS